MELNFDIDEERSAPKPPKVEKVRKFIEKRQKRVEGHVPKKHFPQENVQNGTGGHADLPAPQKFHAEKKSFNTNVIRKNVRKVDGLAGQLDGDDPVDEFGVAMDEENLANPKSKTITADDEGVDYADLDADELEALLAGKGKGGKQNRGSTKPAYVKKEIKNTVPFFKKPEQAVEDKPKVEKSEKKEKKEKKGKKLTGFDQNQNAFAAEIEAIETLDREAENKKANIEQSKLDQDFANTQTENQKITFKRRIFGSCTDAKGNRANLYGLLTSKEEEAENQKTHKKIFAAETFDEIAIMDKLKKRLRELEYTKMTIIQANAFKPLSEGKNCVIKSETGSGKT
jgi:hypothetical protein